VGSSGWLTTRTAKFGSGLVWTQTPTRSEDPETLLTLDLAGLHNLLIGLLFLRTIFTNVFQMYQANSHLHICRAAAEAIVVLDKYQELYKDLTLCVTAEVLDPACKWEYFEAGVENL